MHYITFFMLNSTEHNISTAHKTNCCKRLLAFKLSDVALIILINVKIPTIVGILTSMGAIISYSVELSLKIFFLQPLGLFGVCEQQRHIHVPA